MFLYSTKLGMFSFRLASRRRLVGREFVGPCFMSTKDANALLYYELAKDGATQLFGNDTSESGLFL